MLGKRRNHCIWKQMLRDSAQPLHVEEPFWQTPSLHPRKHISPLHKRAAGTRERLYILLSPFIVIAFVHLRAAVTTPGVFISSYHQPESDITNARVGVSTGMEEGQIIPSSLPRGLYQLSVTRGLILPCYGSSTSQLVVKEVPFKDTSRIWTWISVRLCFSTVSLRDWNGAHHWWRMASLKFLNRSFLITTSNHYLKAFYNYASNPWII
jgi:hypothetical protein